MERLQQGSEDDVASPPYSPYLAPPNYHLFEIMGNFLNCKSFNNDDFKSHLVEFFTDTLNENGFIKLSEKWQLGPAPPYLQPISPLMPFEGEEITARVWINERPLVTTVIGPDLQEGSNQRDGCSFDNPPASKNCCHPWNH
ncbi:hypothetical protein TNCV_4596591 [Trichonephila clavipes]|uniref:Uncharacterized protein n=1 Tax=Trichonephila clavipes TaxID=2585209 RepID=A0A8X6WGX6_TRICX|nr:hypothetical protein TNCV_4596591 [Trichonephila clavipes]